MKELRASASTKGKTRKRGEGLSRNVIHQNRRRLRECRKRNRNEMALSLVALGSTLDVGDVVPEKGRGKEGGRGRSGRTKEVGSASIWGTEGPEKKERGLG